MNGAKICEIAAALAEAERDRKPIDPVSATWPGLTVDDAYHVQLHNAGRRVVGGASVVGYKVGLTSAAMQQMLGVDQPDFGHLFDDMVVEGAVAAERFLQPRAETEIAFVLRAPLRGPGVTAEQVLAATDYVCTAIEIIDSRIAGWRIGLTDTIADNASSAALVLGTKRLAPGAIDMAAAEGRTLVDGRVIESGPGSAVLGHPAAAVAWLANTLGARDVTLEAGHIVLPGACARAVDVRSGMTVAADVDGFGAAEIRFT